MLCHPSMKYVFVLCVGVAVYVLILLLCYPASTWDVMVGTINRAVYADHSLSAKEHAHSIIYNSNGIGYVNDGEYVRYVGF